MKATMLASRVAQPAHKEWEAELEDDPIIYEEAVLDDLRDAKLERLRTLQPFVLDNSLRETSVAAIRNHTLKDKWSIIRMIKESGLNQFIIASFNAMKQVDDQFALDMKDKGVICSNCYAFCEGWEQWDANRVPKKEATLGLQKMKAYGIQNALIECNFACRQTDWSKFGEDGLFALITERCRYVRRELSLPHRLRPAASFINIRDFTTAMVEVPDRVLRTVGRIGRMDPEYRPAGLMFEDPSGGKFPFELAPWVASVRKAMDDAGWMEGHFLVHIHRNYGLAQALVLECLASGADGVWAAICDEGAATGHAGSLATLVNLARLGNPHVRKQFNLVRMRNSAVRMTKLVTGAEPHPRTEVYGRRAELDREWWNEDGWGGIPFPVNPPTAKVRYGEGKTIDEEEPLEECCFPEDKLQQVKSLCDAEVPGTPGSRRVDACS
ncbi:hypothetical protein HYH03_011437 [Edaphochlamys debaryana]|uniref:Uncharacterized protein n=1 Tax=Edaphochlamys debaryana TaxID=47281 RepID=A0A835XXD4_9CHLO|nr:hypothetical protein HYH03_011437 [Edaphochlamys debaryana]|eukprot:KAG2490131.1 hypothetical protein HYH03_011437 [Edaphochlamys debaryana]